MNRVQDTKVVTPPATGVAHPYRDLAVAGVLATVAAMAATTLAAALAQAVGVDFQIPDGAEEIPLPGFATVTGFFSVVGVVLALALLRWSARPAERFLWSAVSLTATSLVAPLISGAATATIAALVVLHLVAATVMVTTLTRRLRPQETGDGPAGVLASRSRVEGGVGSRTGPCTRTAVMRTRFDPGVLGLSHPDGDPAV
jgi:hypothetical protein